MSAKELNFKTLVHALYINWIFVGGFDCVGLRWPIEFNAVRFDFENYWKFVQSCHPDLNSSQK